MSRMKPLRLIARALIMLLNARERKARGDAELEAELQALRDGMVLDPYLRGAT